MKTDDIDRMSPTELNELKLRVEKRLHDYSSRDGLSLVEKLSGVENIDLVAQIGRASCRERV